MRVLIIIKRVERLHPVAIVTLNTTIYFNYNQRFAIAEKLKKTESQIHAKTDLYFCRKCKQKKSFFIH
jgi:hypothetical protein